ncbi:MAG TPA: hypothetical protein VFW00_14640 [Rhodocyclaceae bacterium]|nr:hypothetical protein [Rhodocyclaceae bacterium]
MKAGMIAVLALLAVIAPNANASTVKPIIDCSAALNTTPCVAESFGIQSDPDALAAKGYGLLRVTTRFGIYGDLAFEVVWPPEGGPWLFVRDPSGIGRGQRVAITRADYDWFEKAWADVQPALTDPNAAQVKSAVEKAGWTPCADSSRLQVDWTVGEKSSQTIIDVCLVKKVGEFVANVGDRAYSLLPLCSGMLTEPPPLCLRLSGNEADAVEVARLLDNAERTNTCPASVLSDQVHLITKEMTLQGKSAVASWLAKNCEAMAYAVPDDVAGMVDSTVLVTGREAAMIYKKLPDGSYQDQFKAAQFSQTWRRNDAGKFVITSWKIGPFVEVNSLF